ncbi:hypothetical protein [Arthrobacter sp. M4]|uniref:hypothetical protein n=1 Tax=Arthrobacter sp. M4 TaxID=218160 RepID=UPI001CDB65A6|nr:hypothetical protein [Arthrobacter sp. M4]MCA4132941.1 hypothetical protein [Arthrobacter sp. M4]
MTGPTTTGSIDAKLTLDRSDFKRGMDEARAEAREVGSLSPTVKVDANVGPALAKLEAVAKAERNLENSYMRSTIAQEKLDAVTKKYGDDSIQAASARLTLKRAVDAESDAEAKLAAAKSKSTEEQDKNTGAVNRAHEANRRHVSGLSVLIAMSPAILSAAAPIGAAAIGLGAAFGVMAGAGVAAVVGIKKEMESGSDVGNQYAAQLGSLKANMLQLSQTSAAGMLTAFTQSVDGINDRMPFLNRMIGDSSSLLGNMGGTALRGVLSGLEKMNPLLQQGGVELGKFVTWLFSFTNSDGFSQFIVYAQQNLPSVMRLIENLVTLGGNILAAFAPLGPVVITVLSGIADGLNSLPLPVLAGLLTTATALGPAMNIAFNTTMARTIITVAEAIGFTGVMANLAVPVVGVLTAAIAGLGVMAATSAVSTDQGTASLVSYGDAVERDNGLIGENVRLQAAHAATTKEMREAAASLGLSTQTVTKAILGNKDAIDTVNEVMAEAIDRRAEFRRGDENLTDTSLRLTHAKETLTNGIRSNSDSIQDNLEAHKELTTIKQDTARATDAESLALMLNANTYGTSVSMYGQAAAAMDKAKESTEAQTLAMQLQNNAAGLLKEAWEVLNGTGLSLEQAQTRSAAATNSVTKSFQTNGLAIQGTTEAAVANQQALQNKATADQAAAEAVAKATGSTEKGTAAYGASKAALEESMRSQGLLTEEVQNYINKLYDVDKLKVKPTKLDIDKAEAELKLQGFQNAINSLTGKTVTIYTQERISTVRDSGDTGTANAMNTANQYATGNAYRSEGGEIPQYRADGGPINYLAAGGSPFIPRGTDVVPAMLTPKEFVIKRASAESIGLPALDYMNRTGQLPPQQQPVINLTAIVTNPFTGEEVQAVVRSVAYDQAESAIFRANQDAQRRPSR